VESYDLPSCEFRLSRKEGVHRFGGKKTQGRLEPIEKEFRLWKVSIWDTIPPAIETYVVVGSVSVPQKCLPRHVPPYRVGQGWAGGSFFRIQVDDDELIRPFLVFHYNYKSVIPTILVNVSVCLKSSNGMSN
jgi:hypothetical protein